MRNWLFIDCNNLGWRAFHAMGDLSHHGVKTAVVFGFLKDIEMLQELFGIQRIAFCFDVDISKRKLLDPTYKGNREGGSNEEQAAREECREQLKALRREYLPALGYRNIFWEKGYEADDIIASLCGSLRRGDRAVLVSSDKDLYQLLAPSISIYNPHSKKSYSANTFRNDFELEPSQWSDVKAIAGCGTDNIPGVRGVGEKTAAKFLAGNLKPGSAKYEAIISNQAIWKRNLEFVRLPFQGCPEFRFQKDEVTGKKKIQLYEKLGMTSLLHRRAVSTEKEKSRGKQSRKGFGLRA